MRARFRRAYGSSPAHLLLMLGGFALAAYAASLARTVPFAGRIAIWFIGAAIVHDFVLWPAYSAADRALARLRTRHEPTTAASTAARTGVPWVNHVRVPVVISGCLLAVSLPLVLNWSGDTYRRATGLSPSPYTVHWLVISAAAFGISALAYAGRLAWAATPARKSR